MAINYHNDPEFQFHMENTGTRDHHTQNDVIWETSHVELWFGVGEHPHRYQVFLYPQWDLWGNWECGANILL